MIDFAKRIHIGIDNATTAQGERAEIQRILDHLDRSIREATSGNGKLFVGAFSNAEDEDVMSISYMKHRLVIQSVDDGQEGRTIAGWETGTEGEYPAHLVYDLQSLYCGDGDELMEELGNLLETARVGRAIQYFADR